MSKYFKSYLRLLFIIELTVCPTPPSSVSVPSTSLVIMDDNIKGACDPIWVTRPILMVGI